jgi:hypothetical protein
VLYKVGLGFHEKIHKGFAYPVEGRQRNSGDHHRIHQGIMLFEIKSHANPFSGFNTSLSLTICFWPLERLGCWDARKLGSLKVCNLKGSNAFELSSFIACQSASKTLTFEP